MLKTVKIFIWLLLAIIGWAIAGNDEDEGKQFSLLKLQKRAVERGTDAAAWRDLGMACLNDNEIKMAIDYLIQAFKLDANDPQTLFYLAVSLEADERNELAYRIYRRYDFIPAQSPYRKKMEGRFNWLLRELCKQEMHELVQNEKAMSNAPAVKNALAVFPIAYVGADSRYVPLGLGLSEMLMVDLGYIRELRLLERVRVQELLKELQLVDHRQIDRNTVARAGRMLKAGMLLSGVFDVTGKEQVRLEMNLSQTVKNPAPIIVSHKADLSAFFAIEKAVVFSLIDRLHLEITEEQRRKISAKPTRNLAAFWNYCLGLEEEDREAYQQALLHYKRALKQDPDFTWARRRAWTVGSLQEENSSRRQYIRRLQRPSIDVFELIYDRLQQMDDHLDRFRLPGADNRKAVEIDWQMIPEPPLPPD